MLSNIGTPELIIIVVIILLFLGSTKLKKIARNFGQSTKETASKD
ncbi:MAG: twin-arginine translocase TatA/TatE family subunit, partial [Candidatus Nitrosomaritimum yanchengensis]